MKVRNLQGLFYLLSLIAFAVIAVWFIQNDDVAPTGRTTGLLRLRTVAADETIIADEHDNLQNR
jgi:hypothetical protein